MKAGPSIAVFGTQPFKKLKKIVKDNKRIENYLLGKPCETVFTRVADFQSVATSQKN